MRDLKTLQQDISALLLGGDPSARLLSALTSTSLPSQAKLQIHQNNYLLTLTSSLMDIYPVLMSFVGEQWLEAALKLFVKAYSPKQACLSAYGGDLAAFLGGFEPAAAMPYLSDVARLEWAIYQCQNAIDETALTAKEWQKNAGPDMVNKTFSMMKAHSFITSDFPLLDLWARGTGLGDDEPLDLESGGAVVLVIRPETEVMLYPLDSEEYTYLSHLARGETVLSAAIAAGWAEISSPLADSMSRYVESGFFTQVMEE